jgi:hypothetical protein
MQTATLLAAAALALAAAAPARAFSAGGVAYTKRQSTPLLASPAPLSDVAARVGYAHKLKVLEVRGAWLRVSEGAATGWIFGGNLAAAKPAETSDLTGVPISASETSATTAARPLAPGAADYGDRRGLSEAKTDLLWLEQSSDAITPDAVDAFLKASKKGEYQ